MLLCQNILYKKCQLNFIDNNVAQSDSSNRTNAVLLLGITGSLYIKGLLCNTLNSPS